MFKLAVLVSLVYVNAQIHDPACSSFSNVDVFRAPAAVGPFAVLASYDNGCLDGFASCFYDFEDPPIDHAFFYYGEVRNADGALPECPATPCATVTVHFE